MKLVELSIFGCTVCAECHDPQAEALLTGNYSRLRGKANDPHLCYRIVRDQVSGGFVIARQGLDPVTAADDGELLFLFEKDVTIEVQKLRPDLYFIHSAAVEFEGKAFLIVAPSGLGKSTTTWGLLHEGFSYLSDELAPIDLEAMAVHAYPHAICLKARPPRPYDRLPDQTFCTSRTMHIPTDCLDGEIGKELTPLGAVLFLRPGDRVSVPTIEPISRARAAARVFANALNPLAHRREGLDAAAKIAKTPSFELASGEISATCAIVKRLAEVVRI